MLDVINRYAHGFVLAPIIQACQLHRVFAILEDKPLTAAALVEATGANSGCLAAALRSLKSIEWLQEAGDGRLHAGGRAEQRIYIPEFSNEFLTTPIAEALASPDGGTLRRWLERSTVRWSASDDDFADMVDGALLVPMLLEIRTLGFFDHLGRAPDGAVAGISPQTNLLLRDYLAGKGWLDSGTAVPTLTPAGRFIADRIFSVATVASYRPMLAAMNDLLFGDAASVFARDESGAESHIDRSLNVRGSGFQHNKYFRDIEEMIVGIFDPEPLHRQPRAIVDTGCGDGTLLKRVFEAVRSTRRCKSLSEHPLLLVGVDFNEAALVEAARTLEGYPFVAVKGDIGDPEAIMDTLAAHGIEHPGQVLHIRSFLDHDRPFIPPAGRVADASSPDADQPSWAEGSDLAAAGYEGVYVGQRGEEIAPDTALRSLVEHLGRWKKVTGPHGLIILEVHNLPAAAAGRHSNESESLHFDLYHALSRQFLVEASAFVMACAANGLIPDDRQAKRHPGSFPFTRITANRFRPVDFLIRHPAGADRDRLASLFPDASANAAAALERRMDLVERFPRGQFVVERDGEVLAALYARRSERGHDRIEVVAVDAAAGAEPLAGELRSFASYVLSTLSEVEQVVFAEAQSGFLPDTGRKRGLAELLDGPRPAGVEEWRSADAELVAFCARILATDMAALGMIPPEGEARCIEDVKDAHQIPLRHHRLFDSFVELLEEAGAAEREGDLIRRGPHLGSMLVADKTAERARFEREFGARYPWARNLHRLTDSCLAALPELLTGRKRAMDVVFKDGEVDAFAGLFAGEPIADYFNGLAAAAVVDWADRRPPASVGQAIRIVEIGAGTGSASQALLEAIAAAGLQAEYCYTDVSPFFLKSGERRLEDRYPGIEYRLLDIESPESVDALGLQRFDIVFAAQVLHDTSNLRHALRQASRLLAPGGMMVINEYTQRRDVLLFSGGFLPGFWAAEDRLRFPRSCLAAAPHWRGLLERIGMIEVRSLGLSFTEDEPQSIIIGEWPAAAAEAMPASRSSAPAVVAEVREDRMDGIRRALVRVIGADRAAGLAPDSSFMEAGLDSMELLEIRVALEKAFARKLPSSFLFRHGCIDAVADALGAEPDKASPPPVVETLMVHARPRPSRERPGENGRVPVAVVGMACRFPRSISSPDEFWQLLETGSTLLGELPASRWREFPTDDLARRCPGVDKGAFFDEIDRFDAEFFRISAQEARALDPQQRMLLELSWHALEDAGLDPGSLAGSDTGVFIGACHNDYRELLGAEVLGGGAGSYLSQGTLPSAIPNRISYFYDLCGPSVSVDAACSSSLVAILQATEAIRAGACACALVGAANVACTPTNSVSYHRAGILSPVGACASFDRDGDGFARGEGAAMLVLMPLDVAVAEGREVYGLIRGGAVRHNGRGVSFTAPRPEAQAALLREACRSAGVVPETIDYVEAQAVGNATADAIELEALAEVHAASGAAGRARSLRVGSVKPNLGHLDAAAGIVSVVKVLLCMRNEAIPPVREAGRAAPLDGGDGETVEIVRAMSEWKATGGTDRTRRAGVSSFGVTGVLAHIILDEAPSLASGRPVT